MTTSLRSDFHTDIASIVLDDIQFKRSNMFYFIGKVEPWVALGGDVVPTSLVEIDSSEENSSVRTNSVFYKRILPADVSLVVKRYDWVPDSSWDKWDNRVNMNDKKFYCLVDNNGEYDVYKCLDIPTHIESNTLKYKPSTAKPSGRNFNPVRSIDGYLWKYMYSIPPFKYNRFTTLLHMPVQRALTDSFYSNGAVEGVVVTNEGSGYTYEALTRISVTGGTTTGSGATATVASIDSVGRILTITVNNNGSGYTHGANVYVSSTNGNGAVLNAIATTAGAITSINIIDGGTGYLPNDVVDIRVGVKSEYEAIIPTVASGEIRKLNIIDAGAGYTIAPTITVVNNPTTTVSGKYGNATAIVKGVVFEGKIVEVLIEDPGQDYLNSYTTSIVVQGNGSGAVFVPTISPSGQVIDVYVEEPGSNYTDIKLEVVSTTPSSITTKATVEPILSTSDFKSRQSIVEQLAIPGAIYSANILNKGSGYTSGTLVYIDAPDTAGGVGARLTIGSVDINGGVTGITVLYGGVGYHPGETVTFSAGLAWAYVNTVDSKGTILTIAITDVGSGYSVNPELVCNIVGDGSGAVAEVELFNGSVSGIKIINPGCDYTYAVATITNGNSLIPTETASVELILSPLNGHGHDAVRELYGHTLGINSVVSSDKVIANIIQDYRQFGLMRNPVHKITRRLLRDNSQLVVYDTTFNNTTNLVVDEVLVMKVNDVIKSRYRVIAIDSLRVILQNMSLSDIDPTGVLTAESDSNRTHTITKLISRPTLDKYSGKMLYVSNENPFSFAADRSIVVKTFISF